MVLTRSQIKKRWATAINTVARAGIIVADVRRSYELTCNDDLAEAVQVFEDGLRSLFLAMDQFRTYI